ncbi:MULTISPECIES: hypothetical protein [unclassified Streptomyces]|uniref:hypothetical protein n=1 Tax=unclassified Streptomyces TaxID=2593676 RepID=UPI0015873FD2|nr:MULTISPECIES: hypothetical protein [unclassified Streptomyces]NUV67019.1 hypothetical protein [Streptomyces sp. CAI-121]NUW02236.1 hypothetical protein [Streptomyces sp. CAI 127]NUW13137.1 hypothetical protein [Streptomyces sp. CAI-68]
MDLQYNELTAAERRLLTAANSNNFWEPEDGIFESLQDGGSWGEGRQIRGRFISELLSGLWSDRVPSMRQVSIKEARIVGEIELSGVHLTGALNLVKCYIEDHIDLEHTEASAITIENCWLMGGNESSRALSGDGLTVTNDFMFIGNRVIGMIYLGDAKIGGALSMVGSRLQSSRRREYPDGALNAQRAEVGGITLLRYGFEADWVVLTGAHLAAHLSIIDANIGHPTPKEVLTLNQATIAGGVALSSGTRISGAVSFDGSSITGGLKINGIIGDADRGGLSFRSASIDTFHLQEQATINGLVDLNHAAIRVLDDSVASWPNRVDLAGLSYTALTEDPRHGYRDRLAWIRKQEGGSIPYPYEHLARIYRESGRTDDARRILIAMHDDARSHLSLLGRLWSRVTRALVGYGYQPWLAGAWLTGLITIGTVVFALQQPENIQLIKPDEGHPAFNPFIYSLDLTVPIVNLGHKQFFVANGFAGVWSWISTAAGWIFSTALAASLAGFVKRDGV